MTRRRKILLTAGIVLGLAVLFPVIHHYQLRAATEAYIAELKARGEPMELAQVIPPPVPPEQNSAPLFLKAASLLDTQWNVLGSNPPPAMRMVAPGKAMIGWEQPEMRYDNATNSWDEIESALTANVEGLQLLAQIGWESSFDFDLNYGAGSEKMKFTQLAPEKRAAQKLSASALDALHRGDTGNAVKDVSTMLALVNGTSHDRVVISELVRIAMAQIAVPVTWEVLQSTNVTEKQLADMQREWARLDFIQGGKNALAMERVTTEATVNEWRRSLSGLQHYLDEMEEFADTQHQDTTLDKLKIRKNVLLWRYWWSYPDELRLLKGSQAMLDSYRFVETNYNFLTALNQQEDQLQKLVTITNQESVWFSDPKEIDMHAMLSSDVFSLGRVFDKVMRVEAAKQMTVTAIALKRYQLKNGKYPASLDSLVPEFIAAVPVDPVNGGPLHYRLNSDGTFLLYSVGENGVDNGGDPSLEKYVTGPSYYWQNAHALDWVWPQPATAEEIQKYYEEQARKAKI